MYIWQRKLKYRMGLSGKRRRRKRKGIHIIHRAYTPFIRLRREGHVRLKRITALMVCAAVIAGTIFVISDIQRRINPLINDMALSNLNSIVLRECSSAVSETICNYDVSYNSLINKDIGANGEVRAIAVDYAKLNIMKSDMTKEIQSRIDRINSVDISIPLMAFVSNKFYSGVGIPLNIRVLTDENVKVDFYDEFEAEGINQTKHLIKVRIIIDIGINVPIRNNGESIETEIPIAESVIAGEVPDTYLSIN